MRPVAGSRRASRKRMEIVGRVTGGMVYNVNNILTASAVTIGATSCPGRSLQFDRHCLSWLEAMAIAMAARDQYFR
jgi:hypothetical protein